MKIILRSSLLAILLFTYLVGSAQLAITTSVDSTSCFNSCDGRIVVTANLGTFPYFYQWKDSLSVDLGGETTDTLRDQCVNKYIIRVIDSSIPADTVFDTISIFQPDSLFLVDTSAVPITCGGTNDARVMITGIGGTAPYEFSVDSGTTYQTDSIFNGLDALQSYYFVVKDSLGCTTFGRKVDFLVPEVLDAFVTITKDTTSCFEVCDGTASVTASGATLPYTYSWINGSLALIGGGQNISTLCAGTNYIQVVPTSPAGPGTSTRDTLGLFDFSGGSSGWTLNVGSSGTNQWYVNDSLSGLAGAFTMPAGPGSANDFLHIGSLEEPVYLFTSASIDTALSPVINTIGHFDVDLSFNWIGTGVDGIDFGSVLYSIDGGITWIVIAGPTSGNFSGFNTWQTANFNSDIFGDQLDNQATLQFMFTWENGASTPGAANSPFGVDDIVISSQRSTISEITRTCPDVDTLTIFEPADITGTVAFTDETCDGDDGTITVNVVGGKGALTYSLNGGTPQTSNVFTGLLPAVYRVTAHDATTCEKNIDTVTIGATDTISYTVNSTDISCGNTNDGTITVTASGGSGPLELSITNESPGSYNTTFSHTGLSASTYKLWVRDSAFVASGTGCRTEIGEVVLAVPVTPALTATADSVTCNGDCNGASRVAISGAFPTGYGFTYQWYNGSGTAIANTDSLGMKDLCAGTYSVEVVTVPLVGASCSSRDTTMVGEPTSLDTTSVVYTNKTSCVLDDGSIVITATGGNSPYIYSVDSGVGYLPTSSFTALDNDIYKVLIRDNKNCTFYAGQYTVFDPTDLAFDSARATNILCFGDSTGTISIHATGTNLPIEYSIDGSTYFDSSNVVNGLKPNNYTIRLRDAGSCTTTGTTVTISQPQAIAVQVINATATNCYNTADGMINITALGGTGSLTYSIDSGATYLPSSSFDSLAPDTYKIMVIDSNNCTQYGGTSIVDAPDTLSVVLDSILEVQCYGAETGILYLGTSLPGTHNFTLALNDTNLAINDTTLLGVFDSLRAGEYIVIAENITSGCISIEDTFTLSEPDSIGFTLGPDTMMCLRFDTTLLFDFSSDTNFTSFVWNDEDTVSTYEIFDVGVYWAEAVDDSGCYYYDTINVIDDCPDQQPQVYVPKAFTPNSDGLNDQLEIFSQNIVSFEMRIYNQWGELMFETADITSFWDGMYNGQLVSTGAYAYKINWEGYRNGILESGITHGNVTVLK